MAKLYTHQMKNLGDCKEVGVYHENKIAVTYPFEIKIDARSFPNVTIKYRVPPKSREILRYHSAAGTFAERQDLKTLPSEDKREEIRTIPQPFKVITLITLPYFFILHYLALKHMTLQYLIVHFCHNLH